MARPTTKCPGCGCTDSPQVDLDALVGVHSCVWLAFDDDGHLRIEGDPSLRDPGPRRFTADDLNANELAVCPRPSCGWEAALHDFYPPLPGCWDEEETTA